MGELHLEIYCERIRREYKVETVTGNPEVNFREAITKRANFNYLHKKQSGGAGQFGRVIGYVEPLPEGHPETFVFENRLTGNNIPPEFHSAIERGFKESIVKGDLTGHPVVGVRVVLLDGMSHPVDSNEVAFRLAAMGAFREGFRAASPVVLEPIMTVEVQCPSQFQGQVVGNLNRRKGLIQASDSRDDGFAIIRVHVPLESMFGYSTDLRSSTEGKGEFSMEYLRHEPTTRDRQLKLMKAYEDKRAAENAKKK